MPVALIGDTNHYHSEWNGVLDNAMKKVKNGKVLLIPPTPSKFRSQRSNVSAWTPKNHGSC